jgi:hypothetical protein
MNKQLTFRVSRWCIIALNMNFSTEFVDKVHSVDKLSTKKTAVENGYLSTFPHSLKKKIFIYIESIFLFNIVENLFTCSKIGAVICFVQCNTK